MKTDRNKDGEDEKMSTKDMGSKKPDSGKGSGSGVTGLQEVSEQEMAKAFELADRIVTKDYLASLTQLNIQKLPQENTPALHTCASLFPITKIVYDRNENNLQKLINTYASAVGFNSNIVMVLHSDGKQTELYLGVTTADGLADAARPGAGALRGNFMGNFPGSLSDDQKAEGGLLDNAPLENLLDDCVKKCTSVSSVSGVGSPREKEDVANENYIQGIEKLIDTMQGLEFTAIFIANSMSRERLADIRAEYEALYSKLAPFLKSELTYNESSSEGVTRTLSTSLSRTVTNSRSSALSAGTTESEAHTEGTATTNADSGNINGSVGIKDAGSIGGGYSHSTARTKNWSDTTTFGTTKTQTSTIGDAESKAEAQSSADGTIRNETTGRSLQITYQNKTVQNLLDRIDEQLNRLKEGEDYGIFAAAAYFLAEDPRTARMAASCYKGLINGSCTHIENACINSWSKNEKDNKVDWIKDYLRVLRHPVMEWGDGNVTTPASIISGRELAVQFGLPRKSVPGVSVIETAAFGRNIRTDKESGRYIKLGKLYHMGRDEDADVELDMDSLTMHTFITGSTGKGKSNAIYTLLDRILEKGGEKQPVTPVTFLVIEPAKGEYKNRFGHVKVYGTNKRKTELLRIDPFRFPEDVDVLEHIDRLIEIFNVCWPMYAAMPAILKDAIERSYMNAGWDLGESICRYTTPEGDRLYPSFLDVLKMIDAVMQESRYSSDSKGDYTGALSTRIKSLTNGIYGQIFSSDALSDDKLFDKNVIVDLSRVGSVETKSLIMGLLILKMQEYRMSTCQGSNSGLKHLTVLEEAHNLLKRTSSDQSADSSNLLGKSVEMLANSIAEMRTYGEGFVIADQAPGLLDMAVIRNTNTKIILGLPDLSDRELVGRAAALNDDQIVELARLKTGVAAVYQNNWSEPILCHIDPCEREEKPYQYQGGTHKNAKDRKAEERKARNKILRYLMLSAPKKLELNTDKVAQLEKTVYKLHTTSDTKTDLLRYIREDDPNQIQTLRNRIVCSIFYSEAAVALADVARSDIGLWYDEMTERLELKELEKTERDKILAIITAGYKAYAKTPEADKLHESLFRFIETRG